MPQAKTQSTQQMGAQAAAEKMDRSGIQIAPHIGFITEPPPGKNGSAMTRDPKFGRSPGVYPVKVVGTFLMDPADPLVAGDAINLCYIPSNVFLSSFLIVTAGVTGTLQDTLATPTIYCAVAGAVTTPATMTAVQGQNLGTMYANTPRAVGPQGAAVVQWQRGMTLQIAGAAGAGATPMIYMLEFSPVYDSGV